MYFTLKPGSASKTFTHITTIVITGYYYCRINFFFFENQLTSGWDTANIFLKINAPGITHKIKVVVNILNIQNSEKFLKINDIRLRKLRFLPNFLYHLVPSFLSISWVSSFGLVVKAVNFKSKVRGFKPPSGKNYFENFFFVVFFDKN